MESSNAEGGPRRSTRLSLLRAKQVTPVQRTEKEEVASSKRQSSVKKEISKKKFKVEYVKQKDSNEETVLSDRTPSDIFSSEDDFKAENVSMDATASDSNDSEEEENMSMEVTDSGSDDFFPVKKKQRPSFLTRKANLERASGKRQVQGKKKATKNEDTQNSIFAQDMKLNLKGFGASNGSAKSWKNKSVKNGQENIMLDDSQFLLDKNAPNALLSSPSTSKLKTNSSVKFEHENFSSDNDDGNDEWVEMEPINKAAANEADVEIQIALPVKLEEEHDNKEVSDKAKKWRNQVRLEIARRRRELVENMHKMHILCYIGHVRFLVKSVVEEQSELVEPLSKILPSEVSVLSTALMEQAVEMFLSAFEKSEQNKRTSVNKDSAAVANSSAYVSHLKKLITTRSFTNDKDLAVIFFALCHCVFKLTARLCLAINPMPRTEPVKKSTKTSANDKEVSQNKGRPSSSSKKSVKKKATKYSSEDDISDGEEYSESSEEDSPKKPTRKSVKKESVSKTSVAVVSKSTGERNYWVEYYDEVQRKWICVDPYFKVVDSPGDIEKKTVQPALYVIGVDNEMGVREIAAKYASQFLSTKYRKLRTDEDWLKRTFNKKLLQSDNSRAVMEDAEIRKYLKNLPMPSVVSEFKNHPLYVLEKDLLKYEAIYPSDVKSLGEIRGHKILPRSSVCHLNGELNWIRLARTVKEGEKPYKVVKSMNAIQMKLPKEQRVAPNLNLFGYWQTVPYIPGEIIDGKIPRNSFGNIYMYQDCMVPKNGVHLRLPGIHSVARRLELEAVPAIVGWEFSGGGNHPLIDGCVVLQKDVETLQSAWEEYTQNKAEKEAKKADERIWNNWKRLIKGKLLLENMRSRFK